MAAILSGAMMLRWLADKHDDATLATAAGRVEAAVDRTLEAGDFVPTDLGGRARCSEMTDAILRAMA